MGTRPGTGQGGAGHGAPGDGRQSSGQGGEEDPGSMSLAPPGAGGKREPRLPPRPIVGDRDWIIPIECTGKGLTVITGGRTYALAELTPSGDAAKRLIEDVKQMVQRQQATVRDGEPRYRPIIRFLVRPDGLEALHRTYPLLAPLGLKMHQFEMKQDEVIDSSVFRP
jgi:hypothetical protein